MNRTRNNTTKTLLRTTLESVLVALVLFSFFGALSSEAAVRRLESVGVVGVRDQDALSMRRDRAVQASIEDAVFRVAKSLIVEDPLEELSEELRESLNELIGKSAVEYTARYRILEDRGERVAVFAVEDEIENEYVVLVEVFVDEDRLHAALQVGGLIEEDAPVAGPQNKLRVIVHELPSYAAYAGLRRALESIDGVENPVPIEFRNQQVVLELDTDRAPRAIYNALKRALPDNLVLVEGRMLKQDLAIRVEVIPETPENESETLPPVGSDWKS